MTTIKDILKIHRPRPRHRVIKQIAERWSPRHFSNRKIPQGALERIFEAARWAPSAHNRQPWHYFSVKKGTASYKKLFSTLDPYNKSWARTAPVLVIACAIPKDKNKGNRFAFYDLGASVLSLVLQAQSLGYFARQMGLFDKEKVKKLFQLEKNLEPFVVIAIGKIGDYKTASKKVIEYELSPRPRKTVIFTEV